MNTNITTRSIQPKPSLWFRIGLGTLLAAAALLLAASPTQAVNFAGNGSTDWDGAIGKGTLTLTDDGTNINGTLTVGGHLDNVLVIYIQTGVGGSFADTSGFLDNGDGSRKAISGYNGSGQQSVLTFASGFRPNYAIALGPSPSVNSYGGLWGLTNGGANSLPWITSVNLTPLDDVGPYTFSFAASQIGLTPGVNATFKLFGTLISNSGYRSSEALAGNDTGTDGWAPWTQTAFASYTFDAGAPVTYPVTFSVDMTVPLASGAFNPGAGDTVYAAGSFQASPWSGFQLSVTANTNIYTGTAQDADPLGTGEQYKFEYYSVSSASSTWEGVDNRPFTLASSQSLPLVYFDDVAPAPGTNLVTFQIDMTPQVQLGYFDPSNNVVEVRGTFQTPNKWVGGFTLTNNPNGANTNLFSGTYPDGNYSGSWENYKFVYTNSVTSAVTYESIANRDFYTPSGPTTFPVAYFNNISSAYSIPVTFQVDMTVPILVGEFNPGNGDTVGAAGTFQAPNWVVGAGGCVLTNNSSPGANSNLYSGTFIDKDTPGTYEQYKFIINTNGGGTAYEPPSGVNRSFTLASSAQALPVVYWGNNDANNVALTPTLVTFTVDMNNAVDEYGYPFDPSNDALFVNGDWIPWWSWTNPLLGSPGQDGQYQLTEIGLGTLYTVTVTVPAGNSLELTYKYGIYHNTSAANTNADNEAGFALNHVRFIRNTGNYTLPTDIFGQQRTNAPAATEISFGNLAIGAPAAGRVPVSWLGRPGVYLQTETNLVGGQWQTHPETAGLLGPTTYGLSATNWPMSGNALFFRLINP